MADHNWFRKNTWTAVDKKHFFERLHRSRSVSNKAQYLRIQASYLAEAGVEDLVQEALELLDLVLKQYPEPFELACVHHQRARCLQTLGRVVEAISAFRDALSQQRSGKGAVPGDAYLDCADLILRLGRDDLFDEALSVLDEFGGLALTSLDRYRSGVIRALIFESRGESRKAAAFARVALAASAETESVFRYHRDFGVVRQLDPEIQRRLWKLVSSNENPMPNAT